MFENLEEAFSELDKREYYTIASTLASYRQALMAKGFNRREAMRLVENYAKYIYEMALEEALKDIIGDEFDEDVDDEENEP